MPSYQQSQRQTEKLTEAKTGQSRSRYLLIKYSVTSDNKEDEDKNESTHAAFSK